MSDTLTRLNAYKAAELRVLEAGQSISTDNQGALLNARLETIRSAIADLERRYRAEQRSGKRRRGPRLIVASMQ